MSQKTSLPAVSPQKIKSRMLALSMARRFVQLAVLALFIGTVRLGWTLLGEPLLNGTLTSSLIAGSVPMSDPFALLQKLFAGHKPELTMVTGALIVLAIYVIAGGRAFCAWVCPMNIVTDAAYSARKSLNVPASSLRLSRHARYALAAAALLASAISGTAAFEWVSPQAFLWRELIWGVGTGLVAAVTGVFALDLLLLGLDLLRQVSALLEPCLDGAVIRQFRLVGVRCPGLDHVSASISSIQISALGFFLS